ncbi:MAG TPA: sigma-70 family RNA polymerase sigma factor [Gemmatimonadales bacterium]
MTEDAEEPRERITELLLELGRGEARAADVLVPLVYDELRRIAARQMSREGAGHTLTPTGLVHEAYMRLVDQTRAQWVNRAQFFAVAARLMRRILLDHARRVRAGKRGGGWERLGLEQAEIPIEERAAELIALDEALERLAKLNPRLSQVVECRFFGGMTEEETASALGVTDRTVRRDWVKAKAWLHEELPAMLS